MNKHILYLAFTVPFIFPAFSQDNKDEEIKQTMTPIIQLQQEYITIMETSTVEFFNSIPLVLESGVVEDTDCDVNGIVLDVEANNFESLAKDSITLYGNKS